MYQSLTYTPITQYITPCRTGAVASEKFGWVNISNSRETNVRYH